MKNIQLFLIISILFLLATTHSVTAAFDMKIDIENLFFVGETIRFNYEIISDADQTFTFIPYITCPHVPLPLQKFKTISINKNGIYADTYYGTTLGNSIEPQECTAYIEILKPFYEKTEKQFKIITDPRFNLQILACKDKACSQKSKVFSKGETAYFDYTSDVSELEVEGKILGKTIKLPGSVVLNKIGTYNLEIQAEKQDYQNQKQTLEIVVLKDKPKVVDTRISNGNNQDIPKETEQKAKQEIEGKLPKTQKTNLIYYAGGGGIILLIILLLIIKLRKKNENIVDYK